MDIRQNHWNTIAGTGGNGRSCLEKFINSNHRRNVSQRKDFERFRHRERFSCFFLSIRSGNPKRNNSSKNRANRSFRNSRNVPNGFWNSSKNAPRAFYLFILFFFYSSLLEYQQKIEEPRLLSVIRRFLDSFYRSLGNEIFSRKRYIALRNCLQCRGSLPSSGEEANLFARGGIFDSFPPVFVTTDLSS